MDGLTVGRNSHEVLRDRAHLAGDGVLVATLVVDRETGALLAEPEVITRGVVHLEERRDGAFLAEASSRNRGSRRRKRRLASAFPALVKRRVARGSLMSGQHYASSKREKRRLLVHIMRCQSDAGPVRQQQHDG